VRVWGRTVEGGKGLPVLLPVGAERFGALERVAVATLKRGRCFVVDLPAIRGAFVAPLLRDHSPL
jgi:hypothetical protein